MKRLVIAASLAAASLGAHATNFGGANGQWPDYPNLSRYGDAYTFSTQRAYSYQNYPEWHAANGTRELRPAMAYNPNGVNPGGSSTQRLSETTGPASTMNSPQNGHMTPAPGYNTAGNPVRSGTMDSGSASGATAAGTSAGAMSGASTSGSRAGGAVNPGGSATQRHSETTGPASTMNSPQNGHMTPAPSHSGSSSGLSSGSGGAVGTGSSAAGTSAGTAGSMGGAVNPGGSATQRHSETTGPASTMNSPQNGHANPAPMTNRPADPAVRGTPGDRPATGR